MLEQGPAGGLKLKVACGPHESQSKALRVALDPLAGRMWPAVHVFETTGIEHPAKVEHNYQFCAL